MNKLTITTPDPREIHFDRVFDAPRQLVYEAMTTPELVRRWWGKRDSEMTVCEIDLRVGGKWRFGLRTPTGFEVVFHGEYLELSPPGRTVHTEYMEPHPEGSTIVTTLTERDGKTTMHAVARYPSPQIRDLVIQSGMESGAAESYDRMDELLRR
jgi:uncharacterized protein YndB with AHSA1/START domain